MFYVEVLYIKIMDNFFILLVLKIHGHMSNIFRVEFLVSSMSEYVYYCPDLKDDTCLTKLNLESLISNYRRVVVLFLSFSECYGSPFLMV
jgi:hypothetical protein